MAAVGSLSVRRATKELAELRAHPIPGMSVETAPENPRSWSVRIEGAAGTLYAGEVFTLQIVFDDGYPLTPPMVRFVGKAPLHEHVYSNGHICLSILADEWSPALGAGAVCLSVLSMLSSARERKAPPGDAAYVARAPADPRKTHWVFHDDTV
jgi:ubiquitin-conjugating enzyme E2 W